MNAILHSLMHSVMDAGSSIATPSSLPTQHEKHMSKKVRSARKQAQLGKRERGRRTNLCCGHTLAQLEGFDSLEHVGATAFAAHTPITVF